MQKAYNLIFRDLIVQLSNEDPCSEAIAEILALLFELTGNDLFLLWETAEELYKKSMTPMEHDAIPFPTI